MDRIYRQDNPRLAAAMFFRHDRGPPVERSERDVTRAVYTSGRARKIVERVASRQKCLIPRDWQNRSSIMARMRWVIARRGERVRLHKLTRTIPATRAYIQQGEASTGELLRELGVSYNTIARWRGQAEVHDRSLRPPRLATTLTAEKQCLAVELRQSLALLLDDIVEVLRRCVNAKLAHSSLHRCLQRYGVSGRRPKKPDPRQLFSTRAPAGFIHVDLKYLSRLAGTPAYAFVAIGRVTHFVHVEIHARRDSVTAASFRERFLNIFPLKVHTNLSDNGGEWTDRFAVDKKRKPPISPQAATQSIASAPPQHHTSAHPALPAADLRAPGAPVDRHANADRLHSIANTPRSVRQGRGAER